MSKFVLPFAIGTILTMSIVLACDVTVNVSVNEDRIDASGNDVAIEYDFADFTEVDLATAFDGTVTQNASYGIVIQIDENFVDYLNVKKSGNRLKIYLDSSHSYEDATLQADITLPDLEGLLLSGAARAEISGFDFNHDIDFRLSGASRASGTIKTGGLSANVSGASRLVIEGDGDGLDINASGASKVELGDFTSQDADLTVSGASHVTVNLSGTLDANISGASTLRYHGNPTMGKISTSGASTIKKAD